MLRAKEYEKQGKELIYLNIGDPVKFGFRTPDHIKSALIEAVKNDNNYYAESEGILELKTSNCRERTFQRLFHHRRGCFGN